MDYNYAAIVWDDIPLDVSLKISTMLNKKNVKAIKFLCADIVDLKELEELQSSQELLNHLEKLFSLNQLLPEVLFIVKRMDILRKKLSLTRDTMERRLIQPGFIPYISGYRILLHEICENLSADNLRSLKYLGKCALTDKALDCMECGQDFMSALEAADRLSDDNLDVLKDILIKCNLIALSKKISKYAETPSIRRVDKDDCLATRFAQQLDLSNTAVCTQKYPEQMQQDAAREAIQTVEELRVEMEKLQIENEKLRSQFSPVMALDSYRIDRNPRGICVIINNKDFSESRTSRDRIEEFRSVLDDREGTDVDRGKLEKTFSRLGFVVLIHDNCNRKQLIDVITSYSTENFHRNFDCFAMCILSHGVKDHILCCDGRRYSIENIVSNFNGFNCPSLVNKPKLFFLQACQGRHKMSSVDVVPDGPDALPNETDMLIAYSTLPGYSSFRSQTEGSWFMTTLVQVLDECASRYHLLDMLIKVNELVAQGAANYKDGFTYKQCPAPLVTLRKAVWLKPVEEQKFCQPSE